MANILVAGSMHSWEVIPIIRKERVSPARQCQLGLCQSAPSDEQIFKGVKVIGMPQWQLVPVHRPACRELHRKIRHTDTAMFHFHDPELNPLELQVKLIYRENWILNIHEDYPKYFPHIPGKMDLS